MDKNITIPKKEIAPGIYTTGGTATTPSNVITPESLKQQPQVNIPPAQPDTTNYGGLTGGVYDSVLNEYNTYKTATEQIQDSQAQSGSDILNIMNELTGKTAFGQNANEVTGVNRITAEQDKYGQTLADLNAQASILNREAQAIPLQVQAENKNQLATSQRTDVISTERLRDNALKALSIGQQSDIAAAGLTGSAIRLQAAKDKAQQMIDLKYKPLEDAQAIKQKQYDLNKDLLDAYDKKRSEARATLLAKETKDLEEAKAREVAIEKMIVDATPNAPADIIANAKAIKENGGSSLEVAQALGKYGGDYLKTELLKQQIETEKAQRSNIYANIAKTKKETAAIGADGTKLTADEKKAQTASNNLVGLLDDYKKEIEGIGFLKANSPSKRTAIASLKGRITAEYKQAKQLGTLDAGVQKLIDSIIPNPGDFSISSLNNAAQVKAIDDFKASFEVSTPELDTYFNAATGSIQAVDNQINNKEKSFLMSLPK